MFFKAADSLRRDEIFFKAADSLRRLHSTSALLADLKCSM
jgi:hypothetical protein